MSDVRPHGIFVWNELNTRDIAAAKAFYGATLGWSFEPMPIEGRADYCIIRQGDTRVGGIFVLGGPEFDGVPEHWFSYIAVDDVDARAAAVDSAGGAVLRDSQGAVSGWITPAM
ncbi:VOC family protein [Starkeya koreensis]|uniref:VOC family protein n=1 Tax=Ancylobacter koreensis TaxID=266121 RepID=A0ABT0DIV2_9HYPH|nr:VOC family protein [Ancylobacter koreensis]MCK0207017.1 VOC family protein [Ancylobacter koreensis]